MNESNILYNDAKLNKKIKKEYSIIDEKYSFERYVQKSKQNIPNDERIINLLKKSFDSVYELNPYGKKDIFPHKELKKNGLSGKRFDSLKQFYDYINEIEDKMKIMVFTHLFIDYNKLNLFINSLYKTNKKIKYEELILKNIKKLLEPTSHYILNSFRYSSHIQPIIYVSLKEEDKKKELSKLIPKTERTKNGKKQAFYSLCKEYFIDFLNSSVKEAIEHYNKNKIISRIEIIRGSNNKYELNKKTSSLYLDRVIDNRYKYPLNYGYLEDTFWFDGDPLDIAIVDSGEKLVPNTTLETKIIGGIEFEDAKVNDLKLIGIPKNDSHFSNINNLSELLNSHSKEVHAFIDFLDNYKKNTNVVGLIDEKSAHEAYKIGLALSYSID